MASGESLTATCGSCGERYPQSRLYKFGNDEIYCDTCLVKTGCDQCGDSVITIKDAIRKGKVICANCQGRKGREDRDESVGGEQGESKEGTKDRIVSLLKRGGVLLLGLMVAILIRAGDEIARASLRSIDEIAPRINAIASELMFLRPVLTPAIAFYQGLITNEMAAILLVGGLTLIFIDSILFGRVRVFHVVTFPGTIVHEWAHKTMVERYGAQVTDVTYFHLDNQLGYVKHQGNLNFRQTAAVASAPLLFNTVVAITLAAIGTIAIREIGQLGEFVIYWLAFSIGTGALPSNPDIDTIWERVLVKWRQNRLLLFAVPFVLVLRLMLVLRVAYWEAVYGVGTVIVGWQVAQLLILG